MLKLIFKIAFRNLLNNRLFSVINFISLILGIAVSVLITLYIRDELSYDKFHAKHDRIYRVINIYNNQGVGEESTSSPFPLAQALINKYPNDVESSVRFFNFQAPYILVQYNGQNYNERKFYFVDSTIFDIFDYEMVVGNKKALTKPGSVIITEKTANKYFGTENPLGKQIFILGGINLTVTGVIKQPSTQSHLNFDFLASFTSLNRIMGNIPESWVWNPCWTYIQLKQGVKKKDFEAKLPDFVNKHFDQDRAKYLSLHLQRIDLIHLTSHLDYEMEQNNHVSYIGLLSGYIIFIFVITFINFFNLSAALGLGRIKEAAVKKIFGAKQFQLIFQHIIENIFIALVSLFLAFILIELLIPIFNLFTSKNIIVTEFFYSDFIYSIIYITLIASVISGIYPAFSLANFKPANWAGKKVFSAAFGKSKPRKVLVVLQYTISIMLIITTIVNLKQFMYLNSADLGFNKQNIVILPVSNNPLLSNYTEFKTNLLDNPEIKNVTLIFDIIGISHNTRDFETEGFPNDKKLSYPDMLVDYDFIKTFEMKLIAGRDFDKNIPDDNQKSVIINESMASFLGCNNPEQALGKIFRTPFGREKVIGVVKDFNVNSLHNTISPFVIHMPHRSANFFWSNYMAIKIADNNVNQSLQIIKTEWNRYAPDRPFEYAFLEQELRKQYKNENMLVRLMIALSFLALIIASLGIMGLTYYFTQQRTNEIGLRKALGASPFEIMKMLQIEFLKLLIISNFIAWPIGYYIQKEWLSNFAYPIELKLWMFITAGILALFFSLIMVSYQTLKAANANPVDSLRYE